MKGQGEIKKKFMFNRIKKIIESLAIRLTWFGSVALSLMILFVVTNVLSRFIFKKPLPGTIEVIELVTVLIAFFSVGYTEVRRSHIYVELVISKLPRKVRSIVGSIMYLICTAFFGVLGFEAWRLGRSYLTPTLRDTYVLHIPIAPFIFVIAFGSFVLALVTLLHIFHPLPDDSKKEEVTA